MLRRRYGSTLLGVIKEKTPIDSKSVGVFLWKIFIFIDEMSGVAPRIKVFAGFLRELFAKSFLEQKVSLKERKDGKIFCGDGDAVCRKLTELYCLVGSVVIAAAADQKIMLFGNGEQKVGFCFGVTGIITFHTAKTVRE